MDSGFTVIKGLHNINLSFNLILPETGLISEGENVLQVVRGRRAHQDLRDVIYVQVGLADRGYCWLLNKIVPELIQEPYHCYNEEKTFQKPEVFPKEGKYTYTLHNILITQGIEIDWQYSVFLLGWVYLFN